MQPLYSVDHESRHSTNHADESHESTILSENSPLLQRFPENPAPRSPITTVIVSILLLVLIAGILIGIYLLILQNGSENILPPVELPLQLVSRSQWDQSNIPYTAQYFSPYKLKRVTVVHTNTKECFSTETCSKLLQDMQANASATNTTLPYNFLISSNGQTYEYLGWHKSPPISNQQPPAGLVLGFIGNFSAVPPSQLQIQEARNFFSESVSHQYLNPSYYIVGKNDKDTPVYLRHNLKKFPQWNDDFLRNKNN